MKKVMAERLKELRQEKGVSQETVAKAVHVMQHTISQYETGAREPSNEILVALCDFYDVSADYLLGRTDF